MTDKIRGAVAILVGAFGVFQGYTTYRSGRQDWHVWVEAGAGLLLIVIGIWRLMRKPDNPTDELIK